MKKCTACNQVLPVTDFNKRAASKDGLRPTCKRCQRAYNKASYNPGKCREKYAKNRESIRAAQNEYARNNPHVKWKAGYLERCRLYGVTPVVESFTKADVVAKCGARCVECGSATVELDHIVPVSEGGTHTLDNVQFLCREHNLAKR